jgi:hypothetical protein
MGLRTGAAPREGYVYRVGDPIRWRYCEKGGLASWAAFKSDSSEPEGMNIGDPTITELVVLDTDQFYRADPERRWRCESCGWPVEGSAIEIRENYIRRAWIYERDEFDERASYHLIREDGKHVAMLEWEDHLVSSVYGCSRWRLVIPYLSNGRLSIA